MTLKKCVVCEIEFETNYEKVITCSKECRRELDQNIQRKRIFNRNEKLFSGKKLGYDYVECKLCGLKADALGSHLNRTHKIKCDEYDGKIICQKTLDIKSERIKGDKNPGYQHNGRFSPLSKNFCKGELTEKEKQKIIRKSKKSKKEHPERDNTKIEYYLAQGMTLEEAKEARSERQAVFTLEKCVEKHGEEGIRIWKDRQERWQATLKSKSPEEIAEINKKKANNNSGTTWISKLEKEFGDILQSQLSDSILETQFYIRRTDDPIKGFFYDFKYGNKLIEFNGDYWHAKPNTKFSLNENKRDKRRKRSPKEIWHKDKIKTDLAIANNFQIKVVWESDFLKDKEKIIRECINFLTQ